MKKHLALLCALLALCLCLAACAAPEAHPEVADPDGTAQGEETPDTPPADPKPDPIPEPEPVPEPEPEPVTIRLTAAGDDLLHNTLSMDSELPGGGYDFYHLYEHIAKIIEGSDLAFINQEVMLTGEVSAYPNLAAPAEVADALVKTGFNVVNLATNHSLDKGVKGLEACLENVHAREFDAILGAFRTQEEADAQCIVEKQGIRFGFLSYTYGLNGYSLPADKSYMISLTSDEKILADTEAIRPNCDYLIVSMHWGNEYQHTPSAEQERLAQLLADQGVDLIIGTHPHVLQPMKWLEGKDGNQTLCMYSLGNFVSGQHKRPTMLGGILNLELTFLPDGTLVSTDKAGVIPTVTHYNNKGGYTIWPLEEYTAEQAAAHGVKNYEKPLTLDYLNDLTQQVLGDAAVTWESLHD